MVTKYLTNETGIKLFDAGSYYNEIVVNRTEHIRNNNGKSELRAERISPLTCKSQYKKKPRVDFILSNVTFPHSIAPLPVACSFVRQRSTLKYRIFGGNYSVK